MIKLPSGLDINNLIDYIRIYSWQAADILLYYSKLLEDADDKKNILKIDNEEDPVTLADLKVLRRKIYLQSQFLKLIFPRWFI